jgi:peptide/nickel transport system ATP-binding protein
VLDVAELFVDYRAEAARISVLRGLNLQMSRGESVGVYGSSGAGKTTLARTLLRILPPGAEVLGGTARFRDIDLFSLPEREMRAVRGGRIAMVFQEPASALNPLMRIGDQLCEGIRAHFRLDRRRARRRAAEWLSRVGLEETAACLDAYPHQLSGGQRQRALLAGALACEPELLICDEPTSSVDSLLRLRILECLRQLHVRMDLSILWISHELEVLRRVSDRILELRDGILVPEPAAAGPEVPEPAS